MSEEVQSEAPETGAADVIDTVPTEQPVVEAKTSDGGASPQNDVNTSEEAVADKSTAESTDEDPADEPVERKTDSSPGEPAELLKSLLDTAVQRVLSAFDGLQQSFDAKLRYDAKKDGIIDRQFQELSQFKTGLIDKVTMQIVNDIIGEIDSAQKLVKFYENAECNEANFKKLQKVLRDIPASLCDVLEKYGVTSYVSSVGAPFNPKRQRALKTTETGDEAKDKTVRELLRLGFEQELEAKDDQPAKMKILRSEMVDVFVFNPDLDKSSLPPEPTHDAAQPIPPSTEETQSEEV